MEVMLVIFGIVSLIVAPAVIGMAVGYGLRGSDDDEDS